MTERLKPKFKRNKISFLELRNVLRAESAENTKMIESLKDEEKEGFRAGFLYGRQSWYIKFLELILFGNSD